MLACGADAHLVRNIEFVVRNRSGCTIFNKIIQTSGDFHLCSLRPQSKIVPELALCEDDLTGRCLGVENAHLQQEREREREREREEGEREDKKST